jgi:nicotinate-nucleotide pyrophosphorylase (carboxylating)
MDRLRSNRQALVNLVRQALAEDVGSGDATTLAVVPKDQTLTAAFRTRQDCVVSGLPVVAAVFHELDPDVVVNILVDDGDSCKAGSIVATVSGSAQAILTGERTALNYLQRMSGIATLTESHVRALNNDRMKLLDTRKTTPGLRLLEKYAVACGGGSNHRTGLFDQIMIKDNHLFVASLNGPGGIGRAVASCRQRYPDLLVEVEADNLDQVKEALEAQADIILLDNMSNEEMTDAVRLRAELCAHTILEASGGITLERLPELGAIGIDHVSVGALTHSATAVDIGLDIDKDQTGGYP